MKFLFLLLIPYKYRYIFLITTVLFITQPDYNGRIQNKTYKLSNLLHIRYIYPFTLLYILTHITILTCSTLLRTLHYLQFPPVKLSFHLCNFPLISHTFKSLIFLNKFLYLIISNLKA